MIFFKYLSKNNFEKINLLFRIPLIELIVLKSISFMNENLNSNNLENTQQAILPLIVTIFISSFIGWSLGISKNSCNPYFEQNIDQLN